MKNVLITAFEPFNGQSLNASAEIINRLNVNKFNAHIHTLILPTVFKSVDDIITSKIDDLNPDIILLLGEARLSTNIRLERIAINIDDARIPDNQNYQPIDLPIINHGPAAYLSTLPLRTIHSHLSSQNIPIVISNSAGTFLCNHLMYIVLHHLATKKASNTIAGFIHFPYIKTQVKSDISSFLDIDISVKALEKIINDCL
jgi:pyroglutamyl-peptidase